MYHEAKEHDRNCFLTLTYEKAPRRLVQADLKNFIKRLRHHSNRDIRYFAVGEYGEQTRRPHYHAAVFGEDFLAGSTDLRDNGLYTHKHLSDIWGHGFISIGELSMQSVQYISGYCTKKLGDKDTFNIMSRKPPLGKTWVEKHHKELNASGRVTMGGKEYPIPKVYFDWFPELLENALALREENLRSTHPHQWRAGEAHAHSKLALRNHNL